jgi:prophage antirepressor-like protein
MAPFMFELQHCRITDKDKNPWFVAKDVCTILEIKNPSKAVRDFPPDEKAIITTITSSYSGENETVKKTPHNLLILNESGVMRLILKSRKENAWKFKERIIKVISYYRRNPNLNWAALSRNCVYRGKELTYAEYVNQKFDNYLRHHPDDTFEDFLPTLPF